MANNRFNKPKGPVPDFRPKAQREVEPTIDKQPCLVCKKMCHAYGRWDEGHTCSSKCEREYSKPQGEHHEPQSVDCFNGPVYDPNR